MSRVTTGPGIVALAASLLLTLSACAGSRVLDEPKTVELKHPLVAGADETIAATLDWIVVKDGPGTWASNAFWDEYRLRVANHSDASVSISQIQVVDSLDATHVPVADRAVLLAASQRSEERYAEQDLDVAPGAGAAGLVAAQVAGGAVAITAAGYVAATGFGNALGLSTSAAPAVVTMAYVAPVLIVGSIVHASNNSRVSEEIKRRQTPMPIGLEPGEARTIQAFFPIAPSPQRLRVVYETAGDLRLLDIDTAEVLAGLHYADPDAPSRRPREGSM